MYIPGEYYKACSYNIRCLRDKIITIKSAAFLENQRVLILILGYYFVYCGLGTNHSYTKIKIL